MTKLKLDHKYFEYLIAYNSIVNDAYIASVVDILDLKYIHNPDIRNTLGIVFEHYKKHGAVPNASEIRAYLTSQELKQSYKRVMTKFKSLDSSYDITSMLINTETFLRERSVYSALETTIDAYSKDNSKIDVADTFKLFENACNISLCENLGHEYFRDIEKHIDDLQNTDLFIPTGYDWMDEILGGGWSQNGRAIYVFTGATNSGKSIMLGNFATKLIKQNKKVLIITLEMSEMVYSKRISSQLIRIPLRELKNKTSELKDGVESIKFDNKEARLYIKEFPTKAYTVSQLKAFITRLLMKEGIELDAIIIDYLNLIKASNPTGGDYGDVKAVTEETRALSYIFSAPVITGAQLNRSAYNKVKPGLETMGESMGIGHTGDAVFTLWSDENDKELGILNSGIVKNRFGPNYGATTYRIDYETLAVDNTDSPSMILEDSAPKNIDDEISGFENLLSNM